MKAENNEFPSVLFDDQSSAPSTPASGFSRIYTAAEAAYVIDDAGTSKIMSFIGASVYHNTTQSVNNDTATAMAFNTERFDTDAFHDSGSNTKMTIPTGMGGIYRFGATIRFPVDGDGYRTVSFRKGGSDFLNGFARYASSGSAVDTTVTTEGIWTLAAGDYIEVVVRHTAGASLTMPAGSSTDGSTSDFWIYRVR